MTNLAKHSSVGVIIKKDGKILMVDRIKIPLGWACPAGHIDEGETPEQAMFRESKEETGLDVKKYKLALHEFNSENTCSRGVKGHDFYIYEVTDWQGEIKLNQAEHKAIEWFAIPQIKKLKLEPVWQEWLIKLKIIAF